MIPMSENGEIRPDFLHELFFLVMETIAPWTGSSPGQALSDGWLVASATTNKEQVIICVRNPRRQKQYTALICCDGPAEILAISFADEFPGILNPYLGGGAPIEQDLDALNNWHILSITAKAEKGATAVRYQRNGKVCEVPVNSYGSFTITDWENASPVEQYTEVKVDGQWLPVACEILPYSFEYIVWCSQQAVVGSTLADNRWNRWLIALFTELGGYERAMLQRSLVNRFAANENVDMTRALEHASQKFIEKERTTLEQFQHSA